MTRVRIHLQAWLVAAGFALLAGSAPSDEENLDVHYAEHLPLVPDSLLLDIEVMPNHGFVAVGERGHIIHSPDGDRWTQAEVVPTRSALTRVTHTAGRLWAVGHDTVILTSGDWGRTWTVQNFDPERQQPIMDVLFFDDHEGLVIGAYDLYMMTYDGGKTWEDGFVNEEDWHNNAALDLGDGRLMLAGEAGFSYRSEDQGQTWETLEMPYGGSMFGIVRGSGECVVAFGLRGNVQESCDFGDSWEELDSGTESTIAGGTRWQNMNVFVGNSGLVLAREGDGPLTATYHSSGVDFAAVVPAGDGRFLLVGEDGVHHWPEEAADD